MSMHRNFGEWYRQVSIPCTDDSLKKRWAGVESWVGQYGQYGKIGASAPISLCLRRVRAVWTVGQYGYVFFQDFPFPEVPRSWSFGLSIVSILSK